MQRRSNPRDEKQMDFNVDAIKKSESGSFNYKWHT